MDNKKKQGLLRTTALSLIFAASLGSNAFARGAFEFEVLPSDCAKNSNISEMNQKLPRIAEEFNSLSKLPLSGAPLYKKISNPDNSITSCKVHFNKNIGILGLYSNRVIYIEKGIPLNVLAHEAFHSIQNINNKEPKNISVNDFAFSIVLDEATAMAYELVIEQEMQNNNVSYNIDNIRKTASNNKAIRKTFKKAYNSYLKEHDSVDKKTLHAKALEAGGQAVVRYTLKGKNLLWTVNYINLTSYNIRANNDFLLMNSLFKKPKNYNYLRDIHYLKMGEVSALINLTPKEYTGDKASININKTLKTLKGIRDKYMSKIQKPINRNR